MICCVQTQLATAPDVLRSLGGHLKRQQKMCGGRPTMAAKGLLQISLRPYLFVKSQVQITPLRLQHQALARQAGEVETTVSGQRACQADQERQGSHGSDLRPSKSHLAMWGSISTQLVPLFLAHVQKLNICSAPDPSCPACRWQLHSHTHFLQKWSLHFHLKVAATRLKHDSVPGCVDAVDPTAFLHMEKGHHHLLGSNCTAANCTQLGDSTLNPHDGPLEYSCLSAFTSTNFGFCITALCYIKAAAG